MSGECAAGEHKEDGLSCDDGEGACQNGKCANLCADVECPSEQCTAPGLCDPTTGACGAATPDNEDGPCTSNEAKAGVCRSGVCTNLCEHVNCPSMECTRAGECSPYTGQCADMVPALDHDGQVCNGDGFAGVCRAGLCENLCERVTCPFDDCNRAGSCSPVTGACSPMTSYNDNSECGEGGGVCRAGVCTDLCKGVICPSDACNDAGACDAVSGKCGDMIPAHGGDRCDIGGDKGVCSQGACVDLCARDSIVCPSDDCTASPSCGPFTGKCQSDGQHINEGQVCNQGAGVCASGSCKDLCAGSAISCDGDGCMDAGECDPTTGQCTGGQPSRAGTSCNDGGGQCDGQGQCRGLCDGVVCKGADQCNIAGSCDPKSGECSAPQPSHELDECSTTTVSGVCVGGACSDLCHEVLCESGTDCLASVCNVRTGQCEDSPRSDGTTCADGTGQCKLGECSVP